MSNPARDILWPTDSSILVRTVFLYVGQGDATIVMVADGVSYRTILVDINTDEERGGIDVPKLLADLLGDDNLGVFVNTHPHNDHLRGITNLSDILDIDEVWHSGHKPGTKHADAYKDLQKLITKVTQAGGKEILLLGSRRSETIGDAEYHVLAPAEYVVEEIEGETGEQRYQRIHEQCAVLKFGKNATWVMLTGDADRDAWEKHITDYHKDALPSKVLGAAHHGSRSYFKHNKTDDPYLDALNLTAPDYVIISSPTKDESPHDHPHEDAVALYESQVGTDNVLHSGEKRYSFICDIYRDGSYSGVQDDKGELADAYPAGERNAPNGPATPAIIRTRVDDRPQGR